VFLWDQPASPGERRFAFAIVAASTVIFLVLAPFAQLPLPPLPAFIPIYESALVINDLVTAIFLLGQFYIARSRALLLLACGYLFTALMAVAHALSFPGLFSPTGLLGAGPQTTAWLFMFWHGGFPLLVIAYALCGDRPASARAVVLPALGLVLAAICCLTLLATAGHDWLPPIMQGSQYTPAMIVVVSSTWALSGLALWALWHRRSDSVLDLWLLVVMCAWVFDIALSAVLNAGRYDLGFYAGRIYGLVATGFVLVMLLIGNSKLYLQIIQLRESDRKKAAELHQLSVVDPLTGIANRRAFEQALNEEWRRAMRHHTGLCLVMVDVDYFKRFNDTYGHPAGDQCLRVVAQALAGKARRAGEMAARYGGEEFAVLLPHTEIEDAHRLAELMCVAVREQQIPHAASEVAPCVTISVGVASAASAIGSAARDSAGGIRTEPAALLKAADQALYRAKQAGRNRVVSLRGDGSPLVVAEPPATHRAA
jgi:diguanylate cyclase (GGDEF)-like protein